MERGHSLAEHLEGSGRHPVIVFGASASGKSMLLTSLVHALNQSPLANVYLGDPILPSDDPLSQHMHQMAGYLFETNTQKMARGELLPTTQMDMPIFIPIDIERRSGGAPVRLALLEGRGEWYMRVRRDNGISYRDFPPLLSEVIEHYGRPLSVIWVAPFCLWQSSDSLDPDIEESDFALVGALAEYRRRRRTMAHDSHLFVLAKWDICSPPLPGEGFGSVTRGRVASILAERYPNAWPRYQGLPLQRGHRFFMQYSAGHIVENLFREPPAMHRETFERYPQTILNWLYGNATGSQGLGGSPRKVLFPAIAPPSPSRTSLVDRIARFSTDKSFYQGALFGILVTMLFVAAIVGLWALG